MRSWPDGNKARAVSVVKQGPSCVLLGRELARKLGVPYHEDRIVERRLGYRLRGQVDVPLLDGPQYRYQGNVLDQWPFGPDGRAIDTHEVEILTEEVWSRDYWPNTADSVAEAVARLPDGAVTGIYYHGPSMCLVLLHPGGLKVGIRAGAILDPKLSGMDKVSTAIFGKLKGVP